MSEDDVPQASHVQVGKCESCKGAHIVLVDDVGDPIAEGVIGNEEAAVEFCNAVLQAIGSPMRVRHSH